MWRKHNTFDGMRVMLISFRTAGTAYKDPKHGWYVEWDYSAGKTSFGDDCGIRDGEIHQMWIATEPEQIQKLSRFMSCDEIKSANTSSDSISCVKCGHLLKDLGMGPQFKFCPVCEP